METAPSESVHIRLVKHFPTLERILFKSPSRKRGRRPIRIRNWTISRFEKRRNKKMRRRKNVTTTSGIFNSAVNSRFTLTLGTRLILASLLVRNYVIASLLRKLMKHYRRMQYRLKPDSTLAHSLSVVVMKIYDLLKVFCLICHTSQG
jgi:hypothetical protein